MYFRPKNLLEKMDKIEAQFTVVAGSYGEDWQRKYGELFLKDGCKIHLLLVLIDYVF